MHFRDIIAVQLQSHHRMAATLGQQHACDLRIGAWPILIAAAAKGCRVGWRIGRVEQRAINGHQPVAAKEGVGHARRRRQQLTAFLEQRLQARTAQHLTSSAQARITDRAVGLRRMQIAELAHQAVPHLALVAPAPQRHPHHKQHQRHYRAQPHSPCFGAPRLTGLHASLNHLRGIHFTQHAHAHLFAHLVIDRHLASSVHRKLLVCFAFWQYARSELSCLLFFLLFPLSEMYWAQAPPPTVHTQPAPTRESVLQRTISLLLWNKSCLRLAPRRSDLITGQLRVLVLA